MPPHCPQSNLWRRPWRPEDLYGGSALLYLFAVRLDTRVARRRASFYNGPMAQWRPPSPLLVEMRASQPFMGSLPRLLCSSIVVVACSHPCSRPDASLVRTHQTSVSERPSRLDVLFHCPRQHLFLLSPSAPSLLCFPPAVSTVCRVSARSSNTAAALPLRRSSPPPVQQLDPRFRTGEGGQERR